MRRQLFIVTVTALVIGLLQGCAGLTPRQKAVLPGRPPQAEQFLTELDAVVAQAGVQDASSFKVPGFPYLRTNRFLAAMSERLVGDEQKTLWVEEMYRLDFESRKKEIQNLPNETLSVLNSKPGGFADREALLVRTSAAATQLFEYDRIQPDFFETLRGAVAVPDEYSTAMRVFGLYPIAAVPITIGTQVAYNKFRKWHQSPLSDLTVEGRLMVFVAEGGGNSGAGKAALLFAAARRNAFGLPDLSDADIMALVRSYAPIITQDVVAGYDRFGEVVWNDGTVAIDQRRPAIYYYITTSFISRVPVLQINYTLWYSERSGEKTPSYEKGPLDGLTLRISLDRNGQPVMVDIMNNCGCYHFYAPPKERVDKIVSNSNGLYPFVPVWLPPEYPDKPLALRVNSGWHQVEHLFTSEAPADAATYRLIPYDRLEALPRADGSFESVFTAAGIMKNSTRIEPYIFFSVGIHDIGYMRQRSHHAVKMIGRAHFTDLDIFDGNFVFNPVEQNRSGMAW
ncbi:MAG: hypothetical protein PVJ13_02515 [Desulfobacterales bacterium]|jgi:hypothetical protein